MPIGRGRGYAGSYIWTSENRVASVSAPAHCAKDKSTRGMRSYIRAGAFSGLGKERMRLLGQSPSLEKAQYGWRF
jgi:hypothetical protein